MDKPDVVIDGITWHPVSRPPKKGFGWFMGAVLPNNHEMSTKEQIHRWQIEFGTTKVWYNNDAVDEWYEPSSHRRDSKPLRGLITHWAELPNCPLFGE